MTPTVDVCNLALAHIGQAATISAVDPPEGSVYAELCAHMYPLAMGVLLEAHPWSFATVTEQLTPLVETRPGWLACYAEPAACLRIWNLSDTPDGEPIDYERQAGNPSPVLICTNTAQAFVRYTRASPVPQVLPPLFKNALAYQLASLIAGPIVKGDTGARAAQEMLKLALHARGQAAESDANQGRQSAPLHVPVWIAGRA